MKLLFLIPVLLLVSGCVDCMVQGLGAYECGRMKDNAKIIEAHDKKIAQYNVDLKSSNAGRILGAEEKTDLIRRLCTKYKDKPLPDLPLTDHRVLLGLYYENNFCKLYQSDSSLDIYQKEVKYDDIAGRMFFLLSDGEQALEYFSWSITYTDGGFRYGVY